MSRARYACALCGAEHPDRETMARHVTKAHPRRRSGSDHGSVRVDWTVKKAGGLDGLEEMVAAAVGAARREGRLEGLAESVAALDDFARQLEEQRFGETNAKTVDAYTTGIAAISTAADALRERLGRAAEEGAG